MAARPSFPRMTKACGHVAEALPQQETEHDELSKLHEKCYLEKVKVRATCALSCFDLTCDGVTDQGIPEGTLLAAMEEVWLGQDNPSFLTTVLVQVNSKDFIWGSLRRLTDDVNIRALALALYHEAENAPKYSVLLEVAKRVPIEFSYTGSGVSGWMLAQDRLQRKKKDAKYEQDTALATGDRRHDLPLGPLPSCGSDSHGRDGVLTQGPGMPVLEISFSYPWRVCIRSSSTR